MGKKKKAERKKARRGDCEEECHRDCSCAAPRGGPTKLLLLRHGQSEAQRPPRRDQPDPLLTEIGCEQASAWRDEIRELGADVVLVSPLKRAVQTALLAYEGDNTEMYSCLSRLSYMKVRL